jgi:8-oxo-dGTP diphosphatase
MRANAPRYCQCGNRLAWNHAGVLCGSCEREAVHRRAEPPTVTAAFWDTPALRDALAAQHIGRVARAYRRNGEFTARYGRNGVSQELLGTWLGLTQAQVSRIESGPPVRNLDTLAHWARILQVPPYLLWFKLPVGRSDNEARKEFQFATAAPVAAQTSGGLPASETQVHDPDAVAMRAFRTADLQAGGGHLYASVVRYLQADMAPRLFGTDAGASNPALFTAAAALTEMAGWMAHDAGRDASAKRHFGRALAYERDPEAWNAYLAEGNAKQARKRVSADAIVRDSSGRILLVDPTYKPDWDLPGGMAEANEPPADALCRELREELGLDIKVGDLLCVDWVSPHGPWDDLLNFIFDCGALSSSNIKGLRLVDSELRAFEFCDEGQAKERLRPYVWRRASAALEALETRRARYLQDGCA